jgi:transcriptional regulator with XRE-family HTH domain
MEQRLEQSDLAGMLGISRSRVASYEYAKAPIKYGLGNQFCSRFGINQRWFATGEPPMLPYFLISQAFASKLDTESLFSAVFDDYLDAHLEQAELELKRLVGDRAFYTGDFESGMLHNIARVGESPSEAIRFYLVKQVLMYCSRLPEDLRVEYGNSLMEASEAFIKKHRRTIDKVFSSAQRPQLEKKDLTEASYQNTTENVKELLPNLRKKLNKLTQSAGKKSELADFVEAPLASVSRWLSGDREPGGEVTLKLLKWVEQEERK